ncbi:hypothetical protein [Amycolatopsis sp. NBC_01480]|uniref:hypothetical protein n=1 Tax=Amycolatopsis sp. NBC_01480 TaxID=2903562 RepID=UPI002E299D67|nr:hypothetical protein [Amycolatopsis sp. NBC_01480]
MVGRFGSGGQQVLSVLAPGQAGQKIQRRVLLGVGLLAFLLFWWSGWDWWPTVVYAVVPTLIVILPGVRRLVDESWGLIVGLTLAAFVLMPQVPGSLVATAWGLALGAVAASTIRRHRFGWRKWVPRAALVPAVALVVLGGLAWWAGAQDRAAEQARQAAEAHQHNVSKLLPTSPRSAVFALVEAVAVPTKADRVCFAFSPTAAAEFAAAHQAADCMGALAKLRTQVRTFYDYVNQLGIPTQAEETSPPPAGAPLHLDACHLTFTNFISGGDEHAGPQIGMLTFERQFGNGYLITDYQPCRP